MSIIFTRDRAELFAAMMERRNFEVRRREMAADSVRLLAGLEIFSAPYATVWRDRHLVLVIRHEWISEGSVLL